jgi:hypothetical protein
MREWVVVVVVRGGGADGVSGGGVHAGIVCVVHGLCGSGEGGREGHCCQGMREVGGAAQWLWLQGTVCVYQI